MYTLSHFKTDSILATLLLGITSIFEMPSMHGMINLSESHNDDGVYEIGFVNLDGDIRNANKSIYIHQKDIKVFDGLVPLDLVVNESMFKDEMIKVTIVFDELHNKIVCSELIVDRSQFIMS